MKSASSDFPITFEGDSIMLCWAPPTENPDSVDHYELHYRPGKSSNWTLLRNSIPSASAPSITVSHDEVDASDSIFYFAVRSVAKNGTKSDFHYSSDPTAKPPSWYVRWQ